MSKDVTIYWKIVYDPVLLYALKCWAMSDGIAKSLEAEEIWLFSFRRILKISWTGKQNKFYGIEHKRCYKITHENHQEQSALFGHINRLGGTEKLALYGESLCKIGYQ